MGAAAVLMALGKKDCPEVKAVIADCGYTSPEAIVKRAVSQMGIPVRAGYFFAKVSAVFIGGFNLEGNSALEAVKKIKTPVLFIQGTADETVPPSMTDELYEACVSKKKKLLIDGAGHAVTAVCDFESYKAGVQAFLKECL